MCVVEGRDLSGVCGVCALVVVGRDKKIMERERSGIVCMLFETNLEA